MVYSRFASNFWKKMLKQSHFQYYKCKIWKRGGKERRKLKFRRQNKTLTEDSISIPLSTTPTTHPPAPPQKNKQLVSKAGKVAHSWILLFLGLIENQLVYSYWLKQATRDYLAGGFLWTLEPIEGRSRSIVFNEWVSSNSWGEIKYKEKSIYKKESVLPLAQILVPLVTRDSRLFNI